MQENYHILETIEISGLSALDQIWGGSFFLLKKHVMGEKHLKTA